MFDLLRHEVGSTEEGKPNVLFGKKWTCGGCGSAQPEQNKFCPDCGTLRPVHRERYDVFVSYRRDGGIEVANILQLALDKYNKSVFLDTQELQVGRFDEQILRVIETSETFILVMSPGCLDRCVNKSDWLKRELMHALALGKRIIPVYLPGFSFPDERTFALLPDEMRVLPNLQAVEWNTATRDSAIRKIIAAMVAPYQPAGGARAAAASKPAPAAPPGRASPEPVEEQPSDEGDAAEEGEPGAAAGETRFGIMEGLAMQAKVMLSRMAESEGKLRRMLAEVERNGDVIDAQMLNAYLEQIDVTRKSAREQCDQLDAAVARRDADVVQHASIYVQVLADRVGQLQADAERDCGSDPDAGEEIVILDRIAFASHSAAIPPEGEPILRQVATLLADNPQIRRIQVQGHTDNCGDSEHNMQLSLERAEAVVGWLVSRGGIDVSRLIATGYGMQSPIADNATPEGRQLNRRVQFKIVKRRR